MSCIVFPVTPENTINGCPFSVMTYTILHIMKDGKNSLHVTDNVCTGQNSSLQSTPSS